MSETNDEPVKGFALLGFKPEALEAKGLPDVEYPIPTDMLLEMISGADFHPAQLLAWMQEYIIYDAVPWRDYMEPMQQLASSLAPEDSPEQMEVMSERWSLVCGTVDLDAPLVGFFREKEVLAVASRHEDGRLRIMSYQPLDARTLQSIMTASILPAPDGTVCHRPDNWEYLYDNAGGTSQLYSCDAGSPYRTLWLEGLGILDGQLDPEYVDKRAAHPLPTLSLAMSLCVCYELGKGDTWDKPGRRAEFVIEEQYRPASWEGKMG